MRNGNDSSNHKNNYKSNYGGSERDKPMQRANVNNNKFRNDRSSDTDQYFKDKQEQSLQLIGKQQLNGVLEQEQYVQEKISYKSGGDNSLNMRLSKSLNDSLAKILNLGEQSANSFEDNANKDTDESRESNESKKASLVETKSNSSTSTLISSKKTVSKTSESNESKSNDEAVTSNLSDDGNNVDDNYDDDDDDDDVDDEDDNKSCLGNTLALSKLK